MTPNQLHHAIRALKKVISQWEVPAVGKIAERHRTPFHVLISTLISLRTKDQVTNQASQRLFELANTPREMIQLTAKQIEKAIYPAGFYKTKAKTILGVCGTLLEEYNGAVPDDVDELTRMKGVGRKTANLVVTLGYNKLGICVDTHVHRISNRWGYIKTKTPDETEQVLRKKLPRQYWITYNDLLVTFGQNLCVPISPWCSRCPIERYCAKIGVEKWR
ncbi:MAG: endonuclease III [Candidatus Omnitrophica bacterium]|nr:endonuclease III [Candidatus Omnitrophota bacterium]